MPVSLLRKRFGRAEQLPFALATLLGAFLVFQVQPIISKCVLPWFGGTPAVWTTCMLFFQLLLFAGYVYAHVLRTYLRLGHQAIVHISLLLLALGTLPIEPSLDWRPHGDASPTLHLLWLLTAHVGLPYFVLSSTGPLMQAWLSTQIKDDRVYRLYALSNVGSLVALLSYPFLVEPWLSVTTQSSSWSWMFAGFVLVQSIVVVRLIIHTPAPSSAPSPVAVDAAHSPVVPLQRKLAWVSLGAIASTLLLTTTNHVCQDVAVIPFLWILPLSLYLISFIICFDSPKLYHPKMYAALSLAMLILMQGSVWLPVSVHLVTDAGASILYLFFICILCHGEVARLKPAVSYLTQYYAMLSAGGAAGGLIVAVLCPLVLNDYSEQSVVNTLAASLAMVLFIAAPNWLGQAYDWNAIRYLRLAALILPLVSVGAAVGHSMPGVLESERNFFGVLRVEDSHGDRCLVHGTTIHGVQRAAPQQSEPTTYYGRESGIGKALAVQGEAGALEVCGIGLGCGVLATYGRRGDRYDFIEINPAVVRVAGQYFSFLKDSAASIHNHLGDGRLVLDQMHGRRFDIVVLDAFSSDSIPAHLLTREAMTLYKMRLAKAGVIAVHVSNKHLDLAPLVHRLAHDAGLRSTLIVSGGDVRNRTLPALWVVLAENGNAIWQHDQFKDEARPETATLLGAPLWTDQRHNLLSVFRTP